MPGFVGFARANSCSDSDRNICRAMRELLAHRPFHIQGEPFSDDNICTAYVENGKLGASIKHVETDQVIIWIDGDIQHPKSKQSQDAVDTWLAKTMADLEKDTSALRDISGVYAAVVYDKCKKLIHLVTDRHGFRYLYWTVLDGQLIWASELKGFLGNPSFQPQIARAAVEEFISNGSLSRDNTWFEGVQLLPPASVLTWNLQDRKCSVRRYWNWESIEQLPDSIDERELIEELVRRFKQAVRKGHRGEERLGLTLSGGLDSRAIFAVLTSDSAPFEAITYGQDGCKEIEIAQCLTNRERVPHTIVPITTENWLNDRLEAVWWLDANVSLLHFHGLEALSQVRKNIDVVFDGFLGDVVAGGSGLNDAGYSPEAEVWNKARRCTMNGIRLGEYFVRYHLPFADNDFMDLMMGVPAKLRMKARLYRRLLLRISPELFADVPRANTGLTVTAPRFVRGADKRIRDMRSKLRIFMGLKAKPGLRNGSMMADYGVLIESSSARDVFNRLLFNGDPLYRQFVDRSTLANHKAQLVNGSVDPELLCRYATLEIWLQRLYGDAQIYPALVGSEDKAGVQ